MLGSRLYRSDVDDLFAFGVSNTFRYEGKYAKNNKDNTED